MSKARVAMRHFIKTLFGMDPRLLDAVERSKRIEATVDGESDWLLTCKYVNKQDLKPNNEIICSDGAIYRKEA